MVVLFCAVMILPFLGAIIELFANGFASAGIVHYIALIVCIMLPLAIIRLYNESITLTTEHLEVKSFWGTKTVSWNSLSNICEYEIPRHTSGPNITTRYIRVLQIIGNSEELELRSIQSDNFKDLIKDIESKIGYKIPYQKESANLSFKVFDFFT